METVFCPKLLPRPKYEKNSYRKPLEAFVDDSVVIIVGDRQERTTGFNLRLYTNCRLFTAMAKNKKGTLKQQKVFEEKPVIDHLWIPEECSKTNEVLGMPPYFSVGKIRWYTRKDGTRDLSLSRIDRQTHLEVLFLGTVFIYGCHLMEESQKLLSHRILPKSHKKWAVQYDLLKTVAKNFKEIIIKEKIKVEKPDMIKYVDKFLKKIGEKLRKAELHLRKMSSKKGFSNRLSYLY